MADFGVRLFIFGGYNCKKQTFQIGGNTVFKTFSDFVRLASQKYRLPQKIAETIIESKLQEKGLSPIAVVCYINRNDNDCLSQKQIGQYLGITQPAVVYHLQKLANVWPYLFNFGPKPPRTINNHRGKKPISIDLLEDESEIVRNF